MQQLHLFWEKKLCYDVANLANEERSVRMMCERPFDCSDAKKNSKYKYKVQHRDKLKSLFALPGLVSSPAEHIMPSSRGRSGPSLDKNTTNRGPLKLFESNGSMTVAATNKIKDGLCGRTQLEQHEIEMFHAFLKVYLSSSINRKPSLTEDENRLLGQLAVVALSTVPAGQHLSLRNFPRAKPIQITQVPRQYKQGQESHNKRLFKSRIKTGEASLRHLPGDFNDELIAKMFVDIDDEEIVRKTLQNYHNDRLRLNAEDSASLKSYAGLSDNSYIKLIRGLLHFTGLLILAPIKDVHRLRRVKKEEDYSSMSRSVVDMTRETETNP